MPIGLPPTPWIQGIDVPGTYLRGAQLGATISSERNRLAAAAQEQSARLAIAQQQIQQQQEEAELRAKTQMDIAEKQMMAQQQRAAIESQYKQIQLGLAGQRLAETQKMNELKILGEARKSAAMMRIQQRINNNEDPMKVWQEEGLTATGTLNWLPATIRAQQASVPKNLEIKEQEGEKFYRSSPTERYQHVPASSTDRFIQNKQVSESMRRVAQIEGDIARYGMKGKDLEKAQNQILVEKKRANQIARLRGEELIYPEAEGEGEWESARDIGGFKVIEE